ncbi:tRNA (N6-threonylcarbamoyladenosine(37)-N6)-methyltransferase TrmO [Nigerium massiliense]|uniref:tRNA (N6-threonylcarbamoyladenosine(37)-N6)-methyltransferase TrmO n=1 Tax=Nigerium massiliense TaxID=1522317 RepID=UPI000B16A5F1|nr:tRNA (N6-threonylcarbamoyladenosine(37)-N6)-methyltransferase TrmO [Nigerium massiliense]
MDSLTLRAIAHIRTDFPAKFGIPRQSGLVPQLEARVVFEPEFRDPDAVRGLDGFSHLWLLWVFSASRRDAWSPTVRPPRLRGNRRMGVFATRSPNRPNPIGLSSVHLERVDLDGGPGPVLWVRGADLMDGTPILDIKPYVAGDIHADATLGFTAERAGERLDVADPTGLLGNLGGERAEALRGVLAQDPRPQYHHDPERVYGLSFAGWDWKFTVANGVLTLVDAVPLG